MRTSKVTTLVLMTLVWWALSPDTNTHSSPSVGAQNSPKPGGNVAIYTAP